MADLTRLGAQSYSFRKFDFTGALDQLAALGLNKMEFCNVHFPPDPEDAGLPAVLEALETRGIQAPCFGVESFGANAAANRRKFEFARALGAQILTAYPEPDAFDNLDELVAEFGIRIAIHNHGPNCHYDKVEDTLNAVAGRHPFIGACVDTGHSIRSGEAPHEVIERLGGRVISVHLKDWRFGGEETILGEGSMDLAKVADALKAIDFSGPIIMEYENSPEGPVADMKRGMANWRAVC